MRALGYLFVILGLVCLWRNFLESGAALFILGGVMAGRVSVSIRSAGLVIMLVSTAYGIHNQFGGFVILSILIGFVMACFTTRRTERREWGFDIELSDFGGDSGGFGGDGGSDGGGD